MIEGYNLVDAPPNATLRNQLAKMSRAELREILVSMGDNSLASSLSCRQLIRRIEKIKNGFTTELESSPRYKTLQLGLTWDRSVLYQRIADRLDKRIEQGMIEEVESLIAMGATPDFLVKLGLEYRDIYYYISGVYRTKQEFRDDLYKHICHFAKRQMTWFKKEKDIVWLNSEGDYFSEAITLINQFMGT